MSRAIFFFFFLMNSSKSKKHTQIASGENYSPLKKHSLVEGSLLKLNLPQLPKDVFCNPLSILFTGLKR